VLSDKDVQAALAAFECVEWQYDGIGGSVIKWTKQHGNTNDDPAHLLWVVDAKEEAIGAADGKAESASGMVSWMKDMKLAHDRKIGRLPREMAVEWTDAKPGDDGALAALDEAKKDGKAVLVYLGVPESRKDEKDWTAARKECDKLERGALADKDFAKLTEKCVRVRLDLGDEKSREFAKKAWSLEKAPALVLIDPKKDKPRTWTSAGVKAAELIGALKPLVK